MALDASGLRRPGRGDFLWQEYGNLRGGTGPAPRIAPGRAWPGHRCVTAGRLTRPADPADGSGKHVAMSKHGAMRKIMQAAAAPVGTGVRA
jgi:hypothetical protein